MSDCMVVSSELFAELDCFGSLTTTVSGPFTPTPKPCGDQVVGLPVAVRRGVRPVVRLAERDREQRDRQHDAAPPRSATAHGHGSGR